MRRAFVILLMLCSAACPFAHEQEVSGLETLRNEGAGSASNSGSMSEAIVSATGSITHVAIIEVNGSGTTWVIDATPKRGVARYPLTSLLKDNPDASFTVKRLRDTSGVSRFVENAKAFIGRPYDLTFLPDNDAMYCSELIRESFRLPDGTCLFEEAPMNFLAPDGTVPPYWEQLFEDLGMEVPQGVPGTNPQQMSQSPLLVEVETDL